MTIAILSYNHHDCSGETPVGFSCIEFQKLINRNTTRVLRSFAPRSWLPESGWYFDTSLRSTRYILVRKTSISSWIIYRSLLLPHIAGIHLVLRKPTTVLIPASPSNTLSLVQLSANLPQGASLRSLFWNVGASWVLEPCCSRETHWIWGIGGLSKSSQTRARASWEAALQSSGLRGYGST